MDTLKTFEEIRDLKNHIDQLREESQVLNARIHSPCAIQYCSVSTKNHKRHRVDNTNSIIKHISIKDQISLKCDLLSRKISDVDKLMERVLTPYEIMIVRMHELDGLSFRQIQKQTGLNKDKVSRVNKTALRKLEGIEGRM